MAVVAMDFNNLREWQQNAHCEWLDKNSNGIFLGCTGSGKTLAALYCVQEKDVPTLIVVPTIALMNQWREEIELHLGVEAGAIGDGKHSVKRITVAVVNSVRTMDLSYFDMIVLDEAHRYGSEINLGPLINNEFEYKLGITATLKRSDGKDSLLKKLIGPVVYSYNTREAINDGVLSEFDIINVGIDLVGEEREQYDTYTQTIVDSGMSMNEALAKMKGPYCPEKWIGIKVVTAIARRKAIISNAEEKMWTLLDVVRENTGKKIIIFNETIKMAERERKILKDAGFPCEIYHSKMKKQDAIEKFRRGEVKILVSVKSLNEGLDIKDVDVGIRVAGTSQPRDTIQRLGRTLRVVDGKTCAKYYQFYCRDTLEKFQVNRSTNVIKSAASKVTWE